MRDVEEGVVGDDGVWGCRGAGGDCWVGGMDTVGGRAGDRQREGWVAECDGGVHRGSLW